MNTKNTALLNLLFFVLSFLSILAWRYLIKFMNFSGAAFGVESVGYNPLLILFLIINIILLQKMCFSFDSRRFVFSCILGVVIAIACVSGTLLIYTYKLFGSVIDNTRAFLGMLGISIFTVPLIYYLFELFDLIKEKENRKDNAGSIGISRFFIYWGIIFAGFVPIFLSQWPINFVYDAPYQVQNYLTGSISTHHPILHTLLLGWAYDIGLNIHNVALGMMFYTVFQLLVLSAAMARMVFLIRKYTFSIPLTVISLCICIFLPCNPIMSITATKDVLCAAFFTFFIGFFLELVLFNKQSKTEYIFFILFGTLAALFRNNMIFGIALGGLIAVFFIKEHACKMAFLILILSVILLTKLCNLGLIKVTNATSPTKYRETFPIFLQCLARVAVNKQSEVISEMGNDVMDEIAIYLPDYASYNSCNADAIKGSANEYLLKTNTINFFKLWVKVGLKFPGQYIEAILCESMAYWYPLNMPGYLLGDVGASHMSIGNGAREIEKKSYGFSFINTLYEELYFWGEITDIPLIGFLMRCAIYCWFYFIFLVYGIYAKRNEFCLFTLIPFFYLLTCFAGPLVVFRYIFCVATCVPFVLLVFNVPSDSAKPLIHGERYDFETV